MAYGVAGCCVVCPGIVVTGIQEAKKRGDSCADLHYATVSFDDVQTERDRLTGHPPF